MAPGALLNMHDAARSPLAGATHPVERRYLLHRNVRTTPYCIIKSAGNILHLKNGWQVFDASGGAAVSCLGHSNERVKEAMMKQMDLGLSYICSMMFDTDVVHELSRFLIESTNGAMSRIVFYGSGSESVEGAMKLALQYHKKEKVNPEPNRTIFIARNRSYHGATLGALSMSGHRARRTNFETVLTENAHHISPCNPYRDLKDGESLEEYVLRLKEELRNEFERVGPTNVAGFICEPVVGAALGCVPSVPGYLQAMKAVCHEYGALFILDEVMCGMGRCGYLHAWQEENVAPDIQLIGKGLAGGFQAISGMLVGKRIVEAFEHGPGNGAFNHGHTFQNHNIACAAALEVQKIVREQKLLENVKDKGKVLFKKLNQRLADHPNVGNIRGKGLFLGIEFVQDKQSKEPFSPQEMVSWKIYEMGLRPPYGIHVYPGAGTVDGSRGDHVIISPAYNITDKDIDHIVAQVGLLVDDFFAKFSTAVPA